MKFLKRIIDSKLIESVIELPEELKNRKLEISISPADSADQDVFKPEEFRGVFDLNNVEAEIEKLREEWERI